jgi:type VI secretion system lysozyme-like protein
MKERLLKRMRRWNTEQQGGISDIDGSELMESVKNDLEQLFNTRRGTVLIDSEMGLGDLTHLINGYSQPDVVNLQSDLLQQIKRYEPRLSSVDVRFVGDQGKHLQLAFSVTASLKQEKQSLPFSVRLIMNENGSTSVSQSA